MDKFMDYGCYCLPLGNDSISNLVGKGKPVDAIDQMGNLTIKLLSIKISTLNRSLKNQKFLFFKLEKSLISKHKLFLFFLQKYDIHYN